MLVLWSVTLYRIVSYNEAVKSTIRECVKIYILPSIFWNI